MYSCICNRSNGSAVSNTVVHDDGTVSSTDNRVRSIRFRVVVNDSRSALTAGIRVVDNDSRSALTTGIRVVLSDSRSALTAGIRIVDNDNRSALTAGISVVLNDSRSALTTGIRVVVNDSRSALNIDDVLGSSDAVVSTGGNSANDGNGDCVWTRGAEIIFDG